MMVLVTIGSKPPGLGGFLERLKERQEDLINWTLSPILISNPPVYHKKLPLRSDG